MRKTPVVMAAVLAVGTAGVITLAVAQAGAQPAPGAHAGRAASYPTTGRFTVVEHARTDTVVDTGPKGDSRGDLLAFANPVFNATNTRKVGHDQGSCVRTAVGRSWECEWTLLLPKGHLVVQGPFYDRSDSVLSITGGTGAWAKARGQMILHARNAKGTSYDFRYDVSR